MSITSLSQPTDRSKSGSVDFRYQTVRTSRWTFASEKIREWMKSHLPVADEDAVILNACAGKTNLGEEIAPTVIRNDINPQMNAMLQVDVREIGDYLGENTVDVVIHDPPFSEDMSEGKYGTGAQTRFDDETMSQLRHVLKPGGKLIQWAYSPQLHTQFEMENVTLWNRIGRGHDYVATVQTYRPEIDHIPPVEATETVPFNPFMSTVTGNATFGGNRGCDVEMSISGTPGEPVTEKLFDAIDRFKDGLTLIVTDKQQDYRPLQDQNTAIVSLHEDVPGDNWLGVQSLSDVIPTGVLDTVVIDVNTTAFQWNTYYEPDKPWEETTERTGYDTALKHEASKLLDKGGQLIQIGQTATNGPKDAGFIRRHVALTASTGIVSPFVTVDEYSPEETVTNTDDAEGLTTDPSELLYPTTRFTGEQKPSEIRYSNGTEGMYHHPAYAVVCPECGSHQMSQCITENGEVAPHGHFHEERVEKGEEAFYSDRLLLPLGEYIRGWFESTDPGRPKTGGGVNEKPPTIREQEQEQEDGQEQDAPDDSNDPNEQDTPNDLKKAEDGTKVLTLTAFR